MQIQGLRPSLEGTQTRVLYAGGRYNNTPGFAVSAFSDKAVAHQASQIACTAAIPDYALLDASRIHVHATGTFLADSPDPRMYFDLTLGQQGAETALRPVRWPLFEAADYNETTTYASGDYVRSGSKRYVSAQAGNLNKALTNATWWTEISQVSKGVEISLDTVGENCLGRKPLERTQWELDLTVHALGYDGTGEYAGAPGADMNLRVTGAVRFGDLSEANAAGGTSPGPYFGSLNQAWSPLKDDGLYAAGHEVVHHGEAYIALWDIPAIAHVSSTQTAYDAAYQAARVAAAGTTTNALDNAAIYEPGAGRFWRQHWIKKYEEVRVDFVANHDLQLLDQFLHLRLGGPCQMDIGAEVMTHSEASGLGGNFSAYNADPSECVFVSPWKYAPRFDHDRGSSPAPDGSSGSTVGDNWTRHWRVMSAAGQDKMVMHSAIITMDGGRVSVSDDSAVS